MKFDSNFFRGRYWVPGLTIGILVFLILTIYFGYTTSQHTRQDIENLQRIQGLKTNSTNALFLTRKVVAGDASAFEPLTATIDIMDQTVTELQQADGFTRDQLATQYQQMLSQWRSIEENMEVLFDVRGSVNVMNELQTSLISASTNAEQLATESVEILSSRSVRDAGSQVMGVSKQAMLMGQMADSLDQFIKEEAANSEGFDRFRATLGAFDQNHSDLMNGNQSKAIPPVSANNVRNNLQQMSDYLAGARSSGQSIINASEKLLLARGAQQRVASSFGSLQTTLTEMSRGIDAFTDDRFPQVIHVILVALALLVCIVGLILYQRAVSKMELDKEQELGQRSQAAILRLLDELVDLADGDLTISATVSEDFTGAIADSINFTIDQLRQLVSRINSTAVEVSHAAQGAQQTALHLAEASDHQAQEIAGASAAINEMAVTIDQVSANAAESALVAGKSVTIANNGAKLVQNTIHGMDTIREQIQDTSKRIKRLGESSQEIGDIVSLINDIADQTNILALNAAIQASMAGDAGRGFAVVADEVQRLAERSAAATKQIETIVKTIQTDTNEAVISMEQTTAEVVTGARLAQDAGVALEEIEGVSANLAELIQNISNAARQQASSAGHISNTMNVIQEITSQTSSGTGATASSIGELANMALELRESVAGFTLPAEMAADLEGKKSIPKSGGSALVPPTLEDNVSDAALANTATADAGVDALVSELEASADDEGKTNDFFELLAGEEDIDDDLLSEFDVDLSDIELSDEDKKSVG